MYDQLIIGDKSSYDDFSASLSDRKINSPAKKSIKETVPFSNITYDFSGINGELYWEDRELEYTFEISADSATQLEVLKTKFFSWVMNVVKEEIHDPHITEYHFLGTYDSMSVDDDESLYKTTITVKFKAYPYKISNYMVEYDFEIPAQSGELIIVENNSSHRITPTFNTSIPLSIVYNGKGYMIPQGETKDESFKLSQGVNQITVNNLSDEPCVISISFYEEVF